jgi:tetratricopeptide (TPR) repeat protein
MENVEKTRAMEAAAGPSRPAEAAPPLAAPPASSADTPEALAADLAAAAAAHAKAAESLDLNLPEFRESTPQEAQQAEQLLREAHLARRRENYRLAEEKCRAALALVPKDAVALEMLGDLLQGVAKVDEALAAYRRATLADPKRSSAERKYGDLLMRQENWAGIDLEAVPKNPRVSVLLSMLLPGAGQIHNGETRKGALIMIGMALLIFVGAFFGSVGRPAPTPSGSSTTGHSRRSQPINTNALIPLFLGGALYIYAVADANTGARRASRPGKPGKIKSGWEV